MSQAQCSHSKVIRGEVSYPGGHTSEYWKCPDCDTRFWPESTDMHRKKLRITIATAAMQGLIVNAPEGNQGGALCESAFKFADYMLAIMDKP